LGLAAVISGCSAETLPVPPPPTLTSPVASVANQSNNAIASVKPSLTPSSSKPATLEFIIESNKTDVVFPDTITFSLFGSGPANIQSINLIYGTDKHSLVTEANTVKPEFQVEKNISAKWTWLMRMTGSIPPGVNVWWAWELTDRTGKTTSIPKQSIIYSDSRFTWKSKKSSTMNIFWHDQDEAMIAELSNQMEDRLARIQLNVTIPSEREPRIFVYRDSNELRGAILNEQEWAGALAYPQYNIILTAVSPNILEWAKGALPHEITHLLIGEAIFGPFGDIPTWLNEGLAKYAEGDLDDSHKKVFNDAIQNKALISLRSLSSQFPSDSTQAALAYAESYSVVQFLLDTYGWEKMNQLIIIFKDGSTYDNALQKVYSCDMSILEAQWKSHIGTR
jgi:hypothetical protein